MWFDAFAKLVEIVAPPCDIRDNCDTGRQFSNCCDVSVITVSRMSQVSQRPPRQKPKPARAVRGGHFSPLGNLEKQSKGINP